MPQFDWTITFGNVVAIVSIVAGGWATAMQFYGRIDRRLAVYEQVLTYHAKTLEDHAGRLSRHEDMLTRLMGDLQRTLGRIETHRERNLGRDSA